MDEVIKFLSQIDIPNLLVIGLMFWFGYNRLDKKIEKGNDGLGSRIDKLQETVTDIDRRLCRLEGAFQSKECCLLKSDTQHKTAE